MIHLYVGNTIGLVSKKPNKLYNKWIPMGFKASLKPCVSLYTGVFLVPSKRIYNILVRKHIQHRSTYSLVRQNRKAY